MCISECLSALCESDCTKQPDYSSAINSNNAYSYLKQNINISKKYSPLLSKSKTKIPVNNQEEKDTINLRNNSIAGDQINKASSLKTSISPKQTGSVRKQNTFDFSSKLYGIRINDSCNFDDLKRKIKENEIRIKNKMEVLQSYKEKDRFTQNKKLNNKAFLLKNQNKESHIKNKTLVEAYSPKMLLKIKQELESSLKLERPRRHTIRRSIDRESMAISPTLKLKLDGHLKSFKLGSRNRYKDVKRMSIPTISLQIIE